ncbi:MAG: hypothetical protein CRN43_02330 [Candidatus Nephrothrix sp. EaCA]|nr:MAG: hypothetical protein CRN43_02330 [Candidatus Nephrothrix sp. EaCA]
MFNRKQNIAIWLGRDAGAYSRHLKHPAETCSSAPRTVADNSLLFRKKIISRSNGKNPAKTFHKLATVH